MPRHKQSERKAIMGRTRDLLLQAATAEFARDGYAGANINRISRAAGFAKGTVYNYFPSKRALLLALIDEIAQQHYAYLHEQVTQTSSPTQRLERFFEAGFAWVTEHLDQAQVMIATLNGADSEFKAHMYEVYQPMFQLVGAQIVAAGVQEGSFRQLEPEPTARLVMTIYLGVASRLNERGEPWFSPAQVTDLLLDGLRKHASI
jgi:TetR/AcrR family transcriptional repressor of nem operon